MTTSRRLFSLLLDGLNTGEDTVYWGEPALSRFPQAAVRALQFQGLLQPAEEASVIACPGCEDHCFMLVQVTPQTAQREARRFIDCDSRMEMGRIPIEPWRVLQYRFTLKALLAWLGRALCGHGAQEPDTIMPGTLWRWEETAGGGFPIFFCRGYPDEEIYGEVLGQAIVAQWKTGVILTTARESPEPFYRGACVVPLGSLVAFRENQWVFEAELLRDLLKRQAIEQVSRRESSDTLVMEQASRTVHHLGHTVRLPPALFRVLQIIAEMRGGVVSRERLEEAYFSNEGNEDRTLPIERYVTDINRKLTPGFNDKDAYPIESVRKEGYRLKRRYQTVLID